MELNGYNVFTIDDGAGFQWEHVYTYLKATNGNTTVNEMREHFRGINENTLLEGIEEYNEMTKRSFGYFEPFKYKEESR